MPDSGRREDNRRSPTLNALILVTLVMILVSMGYLANYYLGVGSSHQITWYPANPFCQVSERRCVASLGHHGDISLALATTRTDQHRAHISAQVEQLDASRVDVMLERRDQARTVESTRMEQVGAHRFTGLLPLDQCSTSPMRWRLKVVVHTPHRNLGGWFDFDTACEDNQAVSS
ncbi:hypothetical protein [Larsenimonas rhizosphaerae]|uniref:hypothetical protein n=1 Tax=Larsenimonas rhizosphaerae TaxID=2944682 RepID=UPI0020341DE2|nr:hypothetical protein [Larsenimonas rhizosphaerae]MCM2131515.1 hypothetical protein [Larsenimonas rhizosphaerae]